MRTIAIVLEDNDFGHTFIPLLEGLKEILIYREEDSLDRAAVEKIIRSSIMSYYWSYQHRFDLGDEWVASQERSKQLEEYLNPKILFDEEAEKDITTKDHDGGAWYLEIQSGVVRGY